MQAWRCGTSVLPGQLTLAGIRWLGPPRRTDARAARVPGCVACGTRGCHRGARKLSITAATSSISCRSDSSASSAATSCASVWRRWRRAALSMIARRIASDLLNPAASSWFNARSASSSKRKLIATVTKTVYHNSSYRTCASCSHRIKVVVQGVSASGHMFDAGEGNRTRMTPLEVLWLGIASECGTVCPGEVVRVPGSDRDSPSIMLAVERVLSEPARSHVRRRACRHGSLQGSP